MSRQPICRPGVGRIAMFLCGVLVASVNQVSAQDSSAAASNERPFEISLAGLDRPVRVRLTVTVNGTPWGRHFEEVQARYLQALFTQLDGDQDGSLSAGEASRLPAPSSWATLSAADDVHVAFNFRVLDADSDDKASSAELDRYVRFFGNVSMRLLKAATRQPNDELFRFLDANRDRVLQASEWSTVAKLVERDRDGNRVLTAEELRGPMPVAMPPEFVAGVSSVKSARQPLQLELATAGATEPDAEFIVDYPDDRQQARRPQVRLKLGAPAGELGLKVEETASNEPVLVVGGRRLVMRVPPPAVRQRTALKQQLQSEFESVADAAEQLVAASVAMPPLLKSIFRIADRNDDGQLEFRELDHYCNELLSFQVAADAARLRLVESGERRGLMPLVDLNLDGRLSRREVQTLPRKLTTLVGESAQIGRDEMAPTIVLVLQHGPFSEAVGENPLENAGPPWFFRADRNQDGDLDREEFLGTPEDFLRLDTNGDGWIDLDESILGDPVVPPADSEGKQ
jgi:Ca2+-binding EF-hand superfamily protein